MKRSLCYLIMLPALLIASCTVGSNIEAKPIDVSSGTLKVMTYNVHHCNPPTKTAGEIDIDTIAGVIRKQNPDIVALQEIDDHTSRSGAFNEAEEIAKKLNMNFYFGKAIDYGGGGYGVAILSKYPLSNAMTFPLPDVAGFTGEVRILATVNITLPDGKVIRFGCTHLDASSQANRELQIKEIIRISSSESLPFIIGGDFNEEPDNKTIHLLDSFFTRSCITGCGFTIPVDKPTKTIDYIAFRPSANFSVEEHTVIDEKYASDHLPVAVVLNIR